MASNYAAFQVVNEDEAGVIESVGAGISVKVRVSSAGSDVAESPLTTDSDGFIIAGSLAAVAAGTKVHFRVENLAGKSSSISQITT